MLETETETSPPPPPPLGVEDMDEENPVDGFDDDDGSDSNVGPLDEDDTTTFEFEVKELDEPIDPQDRIVVLGYYTVGAYWKTYYDSWGRPLPVVKNGRTVFCGFLQSQPSHKVEVDLRLQNSGFDEDKTPRAVALMRRVAEYGMDMTCFVVGEEEETTISPLSLKCVDEYECSFFSVSDRQWFQREREPFLIHEDRFHYE